MSQDVRSWVCVITVCESDGTQPPLAPVTSFIFMLSLHRRGFNPNLERFWRDYRIYRLVNKRWRPRLFR
jgi:hypothetical protein